MIWKNTNLRSPEEVSLIIKAGKYFCIMSNTLIKKLTPEQEALIPVYVQKWTSLALSTEPIDRQKAAVTSHRIRCLAGIHPTKNR
jgi:hypothetical protein